jgi:hypothetical protein
MFYSFMVWAGIPEGGRSQEEEAEEGGPPYSRLGADENLYSSVRRPDGTAEDDPYAR